MTREYPPLHHATASAHSAAPAATVYNLLTDGANWPRWINLDSMTLEREGQEGGESVGAIRRFRFRRAGIRFVTHEQVAELIPQRRFGYALVSGLPLRNYRANVDLTPTPNGGTHIQWSGTWNTALTGTGLPTRLLIKRLYRQFSHGLARAAERV
ncbi:MULTISPECIES: SRPBCC family protein [Mycobacterium]|uniref:MxaD family protein n=1 Tax=Mycobacterium kiyosense TaxID=2871094 RepID=A0A9P3Q6U9_9MYCO|nr:MULTISPECIES: SRPBCC family protein [Mycobacterium]BDB43207.1 MxaD family protein [Mycobacterium kiyosense]BDE13591.1 MxaD family protein [Mycobacterium sp. 20KCMC460]GLB83397.1 MxaD family protein [Mycobacterium kiyosense]GLB91119.1 MxaD family protein [Mycobacterium kiyosense]GLB97457.1 MxaD family protein [Mycobacterium kiyosense]